MGNAENARRCRAYSNAVTEHIRYVQDAGAVSSSPFTMPALRAPTSIESFGTGEQGRRINYLYNAGLLHRSIYRCAGFILRSRSSRYSFARLGFFPAAAVLVMSSDRYGNYKSSHSNKPTGCRKCIPHSTGVYGPIDGKCRAPCYDEEHES